MITSAGFEDECNGRFSIIKIGSFILTVVLSFEQHGKGDRGCVSLEYVWLLGFTHTPMWPVLIPLLGGEGFTNLLCRSSSDSVGLAAG